MTQKIYPIGTQGQPWGAAEKREWLNQQRIQRSYQEEVLAVLKELDDSLSVEQYGELDYQNEAGQCYPLMVVRSKASDSEKPSVLVTGGVHGYETSGVQGALSFAKEQAACYQQDFNLIIVPCVSPWGYETINRWNPHAIDPNRSFHATSKADETRLLMAYLEHQNIDLLAHIDLHETTDTDNSEFRPALAARDGTMNDNWNIPDGFYLVADSERPQPEFQRAIIQSVAQVTHIAEPDGEGKLIGADIVAEGVIEYPAKPLGLCMGVSHAQFVTTTEVYPDSVKATPELCIQAQVAAICGGLDFLR